MKPRALLLAVGALVTAGAAAYLAQGWLDHQRAAIAARAAKPAPQQPAMAVLVAAKALPGICLPSNQTFRPVPAHPAPTAPMCIGLRQCARRTPSALAPAKFDAARASPPSWRAVEADCIQESR